LVEGRKQLVAKLLSKQVEQLLLAFHRKCDSILELSSQSLFLEQ